MKKYKIILCLSISSFLIACSAKDFNHSETQPSNQMQAQADESTTANRNNAQAKSSSVRPAPYSANQDVVAGERLGTKWGDDISSYVTQVDLKRLSSKPISEVQIRYSAKQYQGRSINSVSLGAGQISLSVVNDQGRILPLHRDGGNYYLSANDAQSYQLRYENSSHQTFEIVASVDGLDVLDGQKASRSKSGYVLRPYSSFAIEGFRKSNAAVASFTFSKPKNSYAANSSSGSIENTGVIGTVVYELKSPQETKKITHQYAPPPKAFPADKNQ